MKRWILPDNKHHRRFNIWLALFLKRNPEFNKENSKIESFYGILHQTVLAGGRHINEENLEIDDMLKVLSHFKTCGIDYYFTFTQTLIKEEMLYDYWGNAQLQLAEKLNCKVIVANDMLENYIREKYPKIQLMSSTTKLNSLEKSIEEADKYYQVVISTQENSNLDKIPEDIRSKIEILVNDCCPPDCIKRKYCYVTTAKHNFGINDKTKPVCYNKLKINYLDKNGWKDKKKFLKHMFINDVLDAENMGFQFFKLTGREAPLKQHLEEVVYYLIKEDMQTIFMFNMIYDLDIFLENRDAKVYDLYNNDITIPNIPLVPYYD